MLSPLDPASQRFLNDLNQIQSRSERAQRELSTGLRINSVADAPDQISNLLQTRSELNRAKQIDLNLGTVKSEVDTAEGALSNAVTLVERAQTLGAQGQSGFNSAATRQDIAGELGSVLQQMVAASQTTIGGRYIFSGDNDQQIPYTVDMTQTNPVSLYGGSAATRQVESPDGSQFAVSRSAQDIFDSSDPSQNVFQSINNLRNALLNNDQTGVDTSLGDVRTAGAYLNQQLAFYGTVQDRVASATNFGANLETQLTAQLSGIQDADETQSITELVQSQTQLQSALASRAKMPTQSLFNYLA